ncbi:metal ABC transporter permease [Billgrantia kenyensis]|uniref:Metal ABC transporter permease n=1 Tax=Billgrantia kenyensis TaxID=321266 RepID=A0A7W0AEU2_9GAMM|nr:metal ABC transporter permease [Halomonas kenyensis]MBA2780711.1 metal ABC transporter permease [Halomonas kenyensis]MCG6663535.1 metal ABC transporter permease [Halomonas kenyensis]
MLDTLHWWLTSPFDYAFMRRALVASLALSLTAPVLGVFLTLRGMSLMGEALSHAILPGVAVAFMLAGFSLPMMMLGGVLAGLITVALAGGVTLFSGLKEDAAMASLFLVAMAGGVTIVSLSGNALDLGHVLFGTILAVDSRTLLLVALVSSAILLSLAVSFRALVVECLDPQFLTLQGRHAGWTHTLFMAMVVLCLVASFQTLGTLMAAGLMLLPAAAARSWSSRLEGMIAIAIGIAVACSVTGLLVSYHAGLPSGPAIILLAGLAYVASIALGPYRSLRAGRSRLKANALPRRSQLIP